MTNLKDILAQGEHETLAFVSHISSLTEIAALFAAFANTKGGKLIIGVKKSGKIVGINPEEELNLIHEIVTKYCQPNIEIHTQTHQENMRLLLEITIDSNPSKFVKAKNLTNEWSYFLRVNNHTLIANKIQLKLWKLEQHNIPKPTTLSQNELICLQTITSSPTPLTISQIYKRISLPKKDIETSIALLLHWKMIVVECNEENFKYHGNNC